MADELRRRAIGQARFLIIGEVKVLRTSAGFLSIGREQTQIGATAVVLARIGLVQRLLAGAVKDLQVHGPVDHRRHRRSILAVVFVSLDDGFQLPIGPVDVVLEHGEGEDVGQVGRDDDATVSTLQV